MPKTPEAQPSPESVEPRDARQEFEKVTNPEELLEFMADHITYGFVGRNKKVYTPNSPGWDSDFETEYFLQSPEELVRSQHGVCWDSVELERKWFAAHGYNPETYFMIYTKNDERHLPTHTFLTFEKDGKWYWFEHSFGSQRGIHEYAGREELIDHVKQKGHEYATRDRGATSDDFENLRVTPYHQPTYGSSPGEFIAAMEHPENNS